MAENMAEKFVICNQLGHYWGKDKTWLDGSDARAVQCIKHRDEAINTVFELGIQDIRLRAKIVAVTVNPRGIPIIEPSSTPLITSCEDEQGEACSQHDDQ